MLEKEDEKVKDKQKITAKKKWGTFDFFVLKVIFSTLPFNLEREKNWQTRVTFFFHFLLSSSIRTFLPIPTKHGVISYLKFRIILYKYMLFLEIR